MIRYVLLELLAIVATLGLGGFLLYESLSQPGQPMTLFAASLLLALGGVLIYQFKAAVRQLQSHMTEG